MSVTTHIDENGRVCTKCKEYKEWDNFYISKKHSTGFRPDCKSCYSLKNKKYGKLNKEKIASKNRKYRKLNKDVLVEKQKLRYIKNASKIKAENTKYYMENRELRIDGMRKYARKLAKYNIYSEKLTALESPRETEDGYLEVKCATCGKYFIPTNQSAKNRVQGLVGATSGENRLYCSDECKSSCTIYKKHKYPQGLSPRKGTKREYSSEFRKMILERDEYTCQLCDQTFEEKYLQAHHISPVVCSPMEQVDIENGICVCKECHIKLHDQDGCRINDLSAYGRAI